MIEIVGYALLVPAIVSIVATFICRRVLPATVANRYSLAVGLAAGFLAGYSLLPDWGVWVPTRYTHWLPYMALAAMIAGPVTHARGVWIVERVLVNVSLAVGFAFLLVPNWDNLEPSRRVHIGCLSAYLFVLATFLPPLADRSSPKILFGALVMAAAALAAMILATVSVRYSQLNLLLLSGLLGCCVSAIWFHEASALRCLVVVFAYLSGALAFVGYIEPRPPLAGLLVLPAALFGLWLIQPKSFPEKSRVVPVLQLGVVLVGLSVGIGWILLAS